MKVALVTTTINVPRVLELYRAYGPDVQMFVAMDRKTPKKALALCDQLGAVNVVSGEWKCSELIGWNTIGRRSVAILEAVKWGAEIIVTIDDDNIPLDCLYFNNFKETLGQSFTGLQANGHGYWFDAGQLLDPVAPHRGYPQTEIPLYKIEHTIDARVGVAAGICLGDPDVDAVTRLANRPKPLDVHRVSELLRAGIVVDPGTWTVFNSQNTAFARELAPCFLLCPQFGRHDDIYASLICQRVMRERDYRVHFGLPFVWQQRNQHDLIRDLRAETWGMEHIVAFANWLDGLDGLDLPVTSVLGMVRHIWSRYDDSEWGTEGVSELGAAWGDDLEVLL